MATDHVAAALDELREILKREGPYSRDHLTHAANVIDAMCERAERAIAHLSRLRPFSSGEPTEGRAFVTYTVEPDK